MELISFTLFHGSICSKTKIWKVGLSIPETAGSRLQSGVEGWRSFASCTTYLETANSTAQKYPFGKKYDILETVANPWLPYVKKYLQGSKGKLLISGCSLDWRQSHPRIMLGSQDLNFRSNWYCVGGWGQNSPGIFPCHVELTYPVSRQTLRIFFCHMGPPKLLDSFTKLLLILNKWNSHALQSIGKLLWIGFSVCWTAVRFLEFW